MKNGESSDLKINGEHTGPINVSNVSFNQTDFGSSKNKIQIEMQVMVLIENLDNHVLGRK